MSAIVLLSGGLDSAVTLAHAKRLGETAALTVNYGQTNPAELRCADGQARGLEHVRISVTLPSARGASNYVPARNAVLLSLATALADATQSDRVYAGFTAEDRNDYPDCRVEFVRAFERMARTYGEITFHTPYINMTKRQVILEGVRLGVDFASTLTCYRPDGLAACGECNSCRVRLRGFAEAGIADPAQYVGAQG